jgi:hypothetical protein
VKKLVKRAVRRIARLAAKEFAVELRNNDERATRRLAELIVKELRAELQDSGLLESARLKVDVEDALLQLSSSSSKERLQDFYVWNHRWVAMLAERNHRTAAHTYDFIEAEMPDAMFRLNQMAVVGAKRDEILELDGHILDLGVYKGGSTRTLCRIFPERTIHGFDSFEGLPEDWSHVPRGTFGDAGGHLPDLPDNAKLYKGWFDETLPIWAKANGDVPISLLRIDCDIYSSTKTIFDELGHLVRPGTWVLFDELIGYRGWEDHEYKALLEFLERSQLAVEYAAYGLTYVLTRVVDPG